jgi:hypothetical protein
MRTNNVTALALAGAAAILLGPPAARAETVDASSTTMVLGAQQRHDTEVDRTVPIFEILNLSARELATPVGNDVGIELSTWGALDLGAVRWRDGEPRDSRLSGDLHVAYAQAGFADRQVRLRLGRQILAGGAVRFMHLDGGEALVRLPGNFSLEGFAGVPVSSRFDARTSYLRDPNGNILRSRAWSPVVGTFTTGGRLSWLYPGLLEVGASYAFVDDKAATERSDVAADLRLTPVDHVALRGYAIFSTLEERFPEIQAAVDFDLSRTLKVTLDYDRISPDLFLSRGSILSVFAESSNDEAGASVHWSPYRALALDLEYDLIYDDADTIGHRPRAKATWHLGRASLVGIEGSWLDHPEQAYVEGRVFGSHRFAQKYRTTLDVVADHFREPINGEDFSLWAVATAGVDFARGWTALVAGTGEVNPFFEQRFSVMAKLAYNQNYHLREVR